MVENPVAKFAIQKDSDPSQGDFFWNGGPIPLSHSTWFVSAFSGVTAFDTDEGLVLVDSGTIFHGPIINEKLRTVTNSAVHTAIFTHGHVDHAFGLSAFIGEDDAAPSVLAHEGTLERFKRYAKTSDHNSALNARQFGGSVEANSGVEFAAPLIMPTTVYDERLDIVVGGIDFELHHARGETDDHTWVWCPSQRVLCTGDLVIWSVPNAGNPQKVQRYPSDWTTALREMAALKPLSLAPGHGPPIVDDPDKIQALLIETADFLDLLVERTLAAMADGAPPHVDIIHSVDLPESSSPWLQPVYDEAEFIIRNIIRFYGGWFSGRPSELKPATRDSQATVVAELAGGSAALLAKAQELANDHKLREACHIADFALEADPGNSEIQEGVAAIYETRAEHETSLMAINLYRSASAYALQGRPYR